MIRAMMRWIFPSFAVALAFGLAGCVSTMPAPVSESQAPARIEAPLAQKPAAKPATAAEKLYMVKKGDTLFSIAREQGVDHRDLAAWNGIDDPARIKIGQSLRVGPPGAVPAAPTGAAEVHPIATSGPVASRSLEGAAEAASPLPPVSAEADKFKRSPKGGKLPYSEENLARLKAEEAAPAQVASVPATQAAAPAEKPVTEKPAAPAPAVQGTGEIDWAWPSGGKLIGTFSEGGNGAEATKGIDIAGKIGEPVKAAADGKVVYVGSGLRGYGNLVIVRHNAAFLSAYAHNSRILVKEGQTVSRGQKIAELGNSDADQPKLHFEVRHQGKPVDPLKYLPAR
jgi:lipoprotein NlpD